MTAKHFTLRQTGVSLVELLVGLVIGLLATLVVMQTFSVFEGQKRSTSGTADAQTNGSIALMHLRRSIETAGYGLPMPNADFDNNVLRCTSNVAIYPIEIQQGAGENGSDRLVVRYSTSGAGAVPIAIKNKSNATISPGMLVENNIGCGSDLEMNSVTYKAKYKVTGDDATKDNVVNKVMIMRGNLCGFADIAEQPTNDIAAIDKPSYIRIDAVPAAFAFLQNEDKLSCMGGWGSYTYEIQNNELLLNDDPIVSGVVGMQAQYGVSNTPGDNTVTSWVEPDNTWTVAPKRNRIKAVRLALVMRNGLKEKTKVTTATPEAWTDTGTTTADIDVSFLPDWEYYRYRVVSTTVPLRNVLWSWEAVK
jgi:type IV pilus assembly protein PilW